ncbi:MAG: mechanosensitive ion channel family protein [Methanoregulaceae archaeon]|nr:mechanosensitive ion channel family protein [Methanoregulaceae archaeon]
MRSPVLPLRYFLLLFAIILAMMGVLVLAEILSSEDLAPDITIIIESPFANEIVEKIFDTLCVAIIVLVLYTIGVYLIVRKIPDEVSRFTAVRIFSAFLLMLGLFLGLLVWEQDPGQIVLIIGIIWGAIFVALRDLIQNVVGSLILLITRVYRVGDRIKIKGVYGIVMDIGVFRTTLMQLDEESGDHPSGNVTTVPNGILFREMVTNTTRDLSFMEDEVRIAFPFTVDIGKTRQALLDVVEKHTRDIEGHVMEEIERLGERKFLPDFEAKPTVYVHIDTYQVLMVVKYFTDPKRRPEIKNRIVEEISGLVPGITEVDR